MSVDAAYTTKHYYGMNIPEKRRIVKSVIDVPRLTLAELSELTDVAISSLEAYRLGYRLPGPKTVRRLAAGLRNHANDLEKLADDLEGACLD